MPHLPGIPRQVTSSPSSSKVSSGQTRPPSPGNIRPIKKELKLDSEKKGAEKEPEKASEERREEGKVASAGAGESASGEEPSVKPEPAHGKNYFFSLRAIYKASSFFSLSLLLLISYSGKERPFRWLA